MNRDAAQVDSLLIAVFAYRHVFQVGLLDEFEPFDFRKSEQLRCQVTEHSLCVRASAVRQTFS